jgi:hypothetical protein
MNSSLESESRSPVTNSEHRPAAGSRDGNFSGRLKALSISDVLEFLRVLNRCGTLLIRDDRRQVSLQVRDGRLVSAASTGEAGSLSSFLLREGQLAAEQHESVQERERNGERVGRILIEAGILTPKGVWEALRRQARSMVLGLFGWEQGEFQFQEAEESSGSGLELDLSIQDLIADGIRTVQETKLFTQRMPSPSSVFEAIPAQERKVSLPLEPHERYVLSLVDGRRSLSQVTEGSEIGEAETRRVIFLLFSVGYLKMRTFQAVAEQPPDDASMGVIRRYNEMFAFLHRYLVTEVGPIGEAVMGRYFEDQRKAQPALLAETRLGRDGTLDERVLLRNLGSRPGDGRMESLVDGLNELLYAELLAIRRTLGTSHEGRAVQGLRDLGLQPVIQPQTPPARARKE